MRAKTQNFWSAFIGGTIPVILTLVYSIFTSGQTAGSMTNRLEAVEKTANAAASDHDTIVELKTIVNRMEKKLDSYMEKHP